MNQVLNLNEGKNLDVLVLREVMLDNWEKNMYSNIEYETSPNYSTDFFGTQGIIEKLMSHMLDVKIECISFGHVNKLYDCTVSKNGEILSSAVMQTSFPLAVCKASVLAMREIRGS